MKVSSSSRRSFLTTSLLVARPVLIAGSPPGLQSASQIKAGRKVFCVGSHPDDP